MSFASDRMRFSDRRAAAEAQRRQRDIDLQQAYQDAMSAAERHFSLTEDFETYGQFLNLAEGLFAILQTH